MDDFTSRGWNKYLEDYSSNDPNSVGKIIVFVEPSWYIGSTLASNGSVIIEATNEQGEPEIQQVQLADISVDEFGVLADEGRLDGQILTADQIRKLLAYDTESKFEDIQTQIDTLSSQISSPILESSEATDSAAIADKTQDNLDELDSLLASTDLALDTLIVSGSTQLASTQVAGTFSQDGTFIIDLGKQINVLGSTLYLQNDTLAGDELGILVDIGAGKATLDNQGNLRLEGTLKASNVETNQLTIDVSEENSQTVGTASINSGTNEITIFTTALQPNAKVLITPLGPTGGKSVYVSEKVEFEGFTVSLEGDPAANNISFDWLIVNIKQLSQAN